MVQISCQRCLKVFKYNYLLENHLKCKRKCKEVETNTLEKTAIMLREQLNKLDLIAEKLTTLECNKSEKDQIICKYCKKQFSRQYVLNVHLGKVKQRDGTKSPVLCKKISDNIVIYEEELGIDINEQKNKLICRFCNKQYANSNTLRKHDIKCKAKEKYEEQLERRVLQARNKAAQNNGQTINNNNINNTININMPAMRAFGDENYDYITTKYLLQELSRCGDMNDMSTVIGKFTRMIHANPAHPENHNVMLRSLNGGFARVFNGKSFEDRQAVDIQDDIIKKIGTHVIEMGDSLDEQQKQSLKLNGRKTNRLLDMQSTLEEDIDGDANKNISKYRAKVKSTLHTNKNTINSTHRLLDSSTNNLTLLEEIINPSEMTEIEE